MEKKRKVLHVLQSSKYSGAENVACTIIKMFNQASDNIIFFYTSPNGKIKDVLNKKNIKYLPMEKLTYFKLKKIINEINLELNDLKSCNSRYNYRILGGIKVWISV